MQAGMLSAALPSKFNKNPGESAMTPVC